MASALRVERIGNATLYLGDCRDAWGSVGHFEAVITDPPYGVQLSGKAGHYRNAPDFKRDDTYLSYEDTQENFVSSVLPSLRYTLSCALRGAVFMADKTLPLLPAWDSLGGIYLPNGCGRGSWGFLNFMHCAFYGKDPYLATKRGCHPNGKYGLYGNDANKIGHPCAKPIEAMTWAVERASDPSDVVIDPFMGSGTTGVACARLGRPFIGIEIEEKYFSISCKRIEAAQRQTDMFVPTATQPEARTPDMFAEIAE